MQTFYQRFVESPLGTICLLASDKGLVEVVLPGSAGTEELEAALDQVRHPVLDQAGRELSEYFSGRRRVFSTPLVITGTAFQERVWRGLLDIQFGQTRSYGGLAAAIGHPTACRAVGGANGRNRLPIFVPCHRVIAADGGLGGFSAGLELKRRLLEHEAAVLAE